MTLPGRDWTPRQHIDSATGHLNEAWEDDHDPATRTHMLLTGLSEALIAVAKHLEQNRPVHIHQHAPADPFRDQAEEPTS